MWKKIIDILNSDNFGIIPTINRAAIINDLLNLARGGIIEYNTTLLGLKYLTSETEYLPIKAAIDGIQFLLMRFEVTENYYNFSVSNYNTA